MCGKGFNVACWWNQRKPRIEKNSSLFIYIIIFNESIKVSQNFTSLISAEYVTSKLRFSLAGDKAVCLKDGFGALGLD